MFTPFTVSQLTADELNAAFLSLPLGLVARNQDEATDTTSGTTELIVAYVNFTALAGRTYKLEYGAVGQGTLETDAFRLRFRYLATNGALTSAGTAFLTRDINGVARALPAFYCQTLTGLTEQDYAIGITIARSSGTGTYSFNGSANSQKVLELYDVGPS
jgi:hypothetical protein